MSSEKSDVLVSPLADIHIQKEIVSNLLLSLGVDLSVPLASSLVMGASDVLILAELAQALPDGANYGAVIEMLYSFSEPQPIEVRVMQRDLVNCLLENDQVQGSLAEARLHFLSETYIDSDLESLVG